ncbi:MAG: hypothetical protein NZM06_11800 [Chloroherpetonaceae bacterium]|nr:hypothetical protein [Chloroherpetonaceae bacterium]MDW8437993.1 hypothetical protein [Chloroherpetonaceae bacterium]
MNRAGERATRISSQTSFSARRYALFSLVALALLAACSGGLEPKPETRSGMQGVIRFKNRAPIDSVRLLFLAGYPTPPRIFPNDFFVAVNNRDTLSLTDQYRSGADSIVYEVSWNARRYEYLIVAQFIAEPTINSVFVRENWRVVGLYGRVGNSALGSPVEIRPGAITRNVNIEVDFWNPIPLPSETTR